MSKESQDMLAKALLEQRQQKAENRQSTQKKEQPKQPEKKEQPAKPSNVPRGEERKRNRNQNREQKKKEERPTQATTTKEKEESGKLTCPYCGFPLIYNESEMGYIHEIKRGNCTHRFRDADEIASCRAEVKSKSGQQTQNNEKQPAAEVETSASSNTSKPQNSSSNQEKKQKNKNNSAGIEVIEVEDMSEEAIRAKLGLLEDESQSPKVLEDEENSSKAPEESQTYPSPENNSENNLENNTEKAETPKTQEQPEQSEQPEQPKQEAPANNSIIGGITEEGKNKLRSKLRKFEEGDEKKMEEYAISAAEGNAEGRKRGVIVRNGKPLEDTESITPVSNEKIESAENTQSSNSSNDNQAPTKEEKKESLEETEVYSGKTTLLTEEVPETQKIFPTLTDVETGEIITIEQPETLIGRDKDCQIIINEKVISHKHAYIILKNDKAYMIDNGSSNGTFAMEDTEETNKFRLPKDLEVEIKDGSIVMLADKKYRFSLEE